VNVRNNFFPKTAERFAAIFKKLLQGDNFTKRCRFKAFEDSRGSSENVMTIPKTGIFQANTMQHFNLPYLAGQIKLERNL